MKAKPSSVEFEAPIMSNQSSKISSKLAVLLKKSNTLSETFFNAEIVLSSSSPSLCRSVPPFLDLYSI